MYIVWRFIHIWLNYKTFMEMMSNNFQTAPFILRGLVGMREVMGEEEC